MFILTFVWIALIISTGKARRSVDGLNLDISSWSPFLFKEPDEFPNYDITRWVRRLHLQQCAIVEIGEGFCAVLDNSGVGEFFLGICPCFTLHTWNLCSFELTSQRKGDCTFNEATPHSNTSARVHRRFCDVTLLVENATNCNCSITIAGQALYKTKGFPTCFLNPLPESLCSPRNVCGIARCSGTTIKGIHTPQCATNCHQRQPFCEEIGPWTSIPTEINSLWSRWSSPKCNNTCGNGFMVAVASCQDQRKTSHRLYRSRIILVSHKLFKGVSLNSLTMTKGVNFSSCPDSIGKCYCEVNIVDGIMRAARFTEPCISTEGCTISDVGTFTFEGEHDPGSSIDFEEAYENDDRERFEDTIYYSESVRAGKRHLLQAYSHRSMLEYESRENRPSNENLKNERGYRSLLRSRLNGDAGYDAQVQEEDNEEDEEKDEDNTDYDEKADDEEEDEEEGDETIGFRGSAKGRRSPRKHIREAKSDYGTVGHEGRPEVDELEKAPMEIRSVTEECDDDTTEPLQYYDYDAGGNAVLNIRAAFALKLVTVNILLWFSWY
ncbi:uncharacterized protein LOC117608051 isoform X2 [Osmia lignaria lignaria]|uniref:uncharacterized protein LOC117608051 isoform X2 n=1 Tax=Osmia lignaria lignaria TaxID=1437193 RepID=UPI00402BE312